VENRIREITPEGSSINVASEVRKMNELLVNASLDDLILSEKASDELLTVSEKASFIIGMSEKLTADISERISAIMRDELGASSSLVACESTDKSDSDISTTERSIPSSLEVITSDTSYTSLGEPKTKRKPKLPEEWVSRLQKSQLDRSPSHDVRGAWLYDKRNDLKHLYAEYSLRNNKNLAYLSESWKVLTNVEKWPNLKALVEAFEEVWPGSDSKQPLDEKHSFPPREYEACKSVIGMINDRFYVK